MSNRSDFISRSRQLADSVIDVANRLNALGSEIKYGGLDKVLVLEDFQGSNEGLTPDQILAFFNTMNAIIGPMDDASKAAIYAIKS